MTRHAVEDMQEQMGLQPTRAAKPEPEAEEQYTSRYVSGGLDDADIASGPSLPSARGVDLDGDGVVSDEEKQIWAAMSPEEKAQFQTPITNIADEIRRRQTLDKKRKKLGGKKEKNGKKGKKGKKDKKKW